jgi:hypothetical protein
MNTIVISPAAALQMSFQMTFQMTLLRPAMGARRVTPLPMSGHLPVPVRRPG